MSHKNTLLLEVIRTGFYDDYSSKELLVVPTNFLYVFYVQLFAVIVIITIDIIIIISV